MSPENKDRGRWGRLKGLLIAVHRREEGVTGLETAIILISFVIVAAVFAFVVLASGLFSAERGKDTVFAGLDSVRGNIEVRGGVTVADADNDGDVDDEDGGDAGSLSDDNIRLTLANAAGGTAVDLDPSASTSAVVMNFIDAQGRSSDVTFTVSWLARDDTNDLLEPGELAEVTVYIPTGSSLVANETFTVEIIAPSGGSMLVTRTMPPSIDQVMALK
jgi:flagellin FlaB